MRLCYDAFHGRKQPRTTMERVERGRKIKFAWHASRVEQESRYSGYTEKGRKNISLI